jgi:hypothetical protein
MTKEGLTLRKCEVLSKIRSEAGDKDMDAVWIQTPFSELKKGNIFRLFDDNLGQGEEKKSWYEDGSNVCVSLSDAAPTEPKGNFVVECLELVGW